MHYLSFSYTSKRFFRLSVFFHQRLRIFKTIKKTFIDLLKRFVNYLIREIIVKKEEHQKIIEEMCLHKDVELSRLGNLYYKEYSKYRYIFSIKGKIISKLAKIPYPSTLLSNKPFQNTQKKVQQAIEFFKQMHVN